jgi:hypothetical protein
MGSIRGKWEYASDSEVEKTGQSRPGSVRVTSGAELNDSVGMVVI